jgi:hypothetical protein
MSIPIHCKHEKKGNDFGKMKYSKTGNMSVVVPGIILQ